MKIGIGFQLHDGFCGESLDPRRFAEETIHRLAVWLRIAMWVRSNVDLDVVRLAQQRVDLFQTLISLRRAACIEVIFLLSHDDDRLRSHGSEEVAVIQIGRQHAGRALLAVLRQLVLSIAAKGRHEA